MKISAAIACCTFIVCTLQTAAAEKITHQSWWPQDKADLPELQAFAEALHEAQNHDFASSKTIDLSNTDYSARALFNTESVPTHFEIISYGSYYTENGSVRRVIIYHRVWVEKIENIMRSLYFLDRTPEKNLKIATDPDTTQYEGLAHMAFHCVKPDAAHAAVASAYAFNAQIAHWKWGTHHELIDDNVTSFIRSFEKEFKQLEQKNAVAQAETKLLALTFEYDPENKHITVGILENHEFDDTMHPTFEGALTSQTSAQSKSIATKTFLELYNISHTLNGKKSRKLDL